MPSSTFADHFSGVAERYAASRPDYPSRLFAYLARMASGRRRAWDCATGNGQAARALARHFEEVIATDASARQLSVARRHRRVRYEVARAEDSGLEAESFDCVTVAQSLHWFDISAFWSEVRRVLVQGGVLAVWCYDLLRTDPGVDAVLDHLYRDVVGPYWPPERAVVEHGYRTLDFPFAEEIPPAFRMEKRWKLEALVEYLGTWSATQRYMEARGEDPIAHVHDELRRAWGRASRVRRVVWPLDLRIGRKEGHGR